jgi:diguanylate cyclase (GGDEF)-like protein
VVARIGGDEFGVLLPETQPDAMPALVERIQIACRAWRGTQPDLQLSVSIGWAAPEPFGDLREALRIADDRMYLAKRGA